MCIRDGRDDEGRFARGATGNPDGRPRRQDFARLLAAAERVGATVTVLVPTRRRPRRALDPSDMPPPAA